MSSARPQANALQIFARQLVACAPRYALIVEREGDVLFRRLEAEQVERLKDEADQSIAVVSGLTLAQIADQLVVEVVRPLIVVVQDAQDVEQRGLARAGRAHDRHQLAR